MDKIINIHFFGGCALTQKNIPRKDRFISVLNDKLVSNLSLKPKFSFSSYGNFLELLNKSKNQIEKNENEIFIAHIRPQPYILISKFIIKYIDKYNKIKFAFNPFLSKRKGRELVNISNPVFNQLSVKPTFFEFNIFLGRLFNINSNSSQYVFKTIQEIQFMCNNNNIQFVILGISPQPMSIQGNIICKKLNDYLKSECSKHKIHYIDNFAEMNNYRNFLSDKLHLSINGHRELGKILFEEIKKTFYNTQYKKPGKKQ